MQPNIRPKSSPRRRKPLPEGGNRSRQATAGADLEFGRFRVLLRRRQLLADGVPVALGTRVFDLLLALLEADGALLTKEQLMSRVWPGVVVSEENVKFQIAALRKVLGAEREMIRTEFGRGYRFTGVLGPMSYWSSASQCGQNGGLAEIFSDIAVGIRSKAVSIRQFEIFPVRLLSAAA